MKRLSLSLLLLTILSLLPAGVRAQGSGYHDVAWKFSPGGSFPASGVTITVCPSTSSGVPCAPVASIFSDKALTIPIVNLTADSKGNFSFFAAPGDYIYTVTGTGITGYTVAFSLGITLSGNNTFTGTSTFTGLLQCKNLDGVRCVDTTNSQGWTGVDVFAQANSAAAAAGTPGAVWVMPGTYNSVVTSLSCVSNTKFILAGVTVNFTAVSGKAILVQNTTGCVVEGPLLLIGPGTATASVGIQLGIGSGGANLLTEHNHVRDVKISKFGKAFAGDGYAANGTYWNVMTNIVTSDGVGNGNGQGFFLVPTTASFFNDNTFIGCRGQYNTTDGWRIDGAYNGGCYDCEGENNGAYGVNFLGAATATNNNGFFGGHFEGNTTADFNFGTANVNQTQIVGPVLASATPLAGETNMHNGTGNIFQPANFRANSIYMGGSQLELPITTALSSGSPWYIFNGESPPSTDTDIIKVSKAAPDSGFVKIGTTEYPIRVGSVIQNGVGTSTMGLTLKKGTGAGNYTTASTTYVVVDSTNLCNTVTIPTGWKLSVAVSGAIGTATGAVVANLALTDNAACSTANAGILVETTETTTAAGVLQPVSLNWVITGDGASHNVALQYKTSNGADSATILNSSATALPTMVFTLMPSN